MQSHLIHIYHSPIGAIKIVAAANSIEELIFLESETIPEMELLITQSNEVIHQCIEELI